MPVLEYLIEFFLGSLEIRRLHWSRRWRRIR